MYTWGIFCRHKVLKLDWKLKLTSHIVCYKNIHLKCFVCLILLMNANDESIKDLDCTGNVQSGQTGP